MRVIAGTARGTRLVRPPGGVRPVLDRAREGLFASLGGLVTGARSLDLFAGTGALGIEALSRGAARCDFVDSSPAAIRAIRENLSRARVADRARVVRGDAARFLARPHGPYDLCLADPPYAFPKGALRAILSSLADRLDRNATLVLTRPSRSSTDVIPIDFEVVRRLVYGDTHILVCREVP